MNVNLNKHELSDASELIALLKELNPDEWNAMLNMIRGYRLAKGADISLHRPEQSA